MVILKRVVILFLIGTGLGSYPAAGAASEEEREGVARSPLSSQSEEWGDINPTRRKKRSLLKGILRLGYNYHWWDTATLYDIAPHLIRLNHLLKQYSLSTVMQALKERSLPLCVREMAQSYGLELQEKEQMVGLFLKIPPEEREEYPPYLYRLFPIKFVKKKPPLSHIHTIEDTWRRWDNKARANAMICCLKMLMEEKSSAAREELVEGAIWDVGGGPTKWSLMDDAERRRIVEAVQRLPQGERRSLLEGVWRLGYKHVTDSDVMFYAAIALKRRLPMKEAVDRVKSLLHEKVREREADGRYLAAILGLIARTPPEKDGVLKERMQWGVSSYFSWNRWEPLDKHHWDDCEGKKKEAILKEIITLQVDKEDKQRSLPPSG